MRYELAESAVYPMSAPITFRVYGEPRGQPRPRAWTRTLKDGTTVARMYDPGSAEVWKTIIAAVAESHTPPALMTGGVRVSAEFIFPRPLSHYRGNNIARPLKATAPKWHTSTPDRDNCEKALLDCLTQQGGFWRDDAQVCAGEIRKLYAQPGERPGATITIESLDQETAATAATEQTALTFANWAAEQAQKVGA